MRLSSRSPTWSRRLLVLAARKRDSRVRWESSEERKKTEAGWKSAGLR